MDYRKIVFAAVLALWGAFSAGGCGGQKEEPVTLTVIHAWGGTEKDHEAMRKIYQDFQEKNPDVLLQLVSMPTREEMLRKVEDMIMVGDTPDIVTFSGMGRNRTYEFMVENGIALDLMPYLEEDEAFADSVSEENLSYWTTEKNQLFTVTDVLYLSGGYWYNQEIFEKAGIEAPPSDWADFLKMCGKIREWSKKLGRNVLPLQASGEGYLSFLDHMLAGRVGIKSERGEIAEALERLRQIYIFSTSESADYTYLDETSLFNEGKIAIYVNGVWGAPMISDNIDAAYALLPTKDGTEMSCVSAGLGYVLGNSGSEEKEDASVRFLKYMLSEEVQTRILEETEQIPANQAVNLEQFAEEKARLYQAAEQVLHAEKRIEIPANLWTSDQRERFVEDIFPVLAGEKKEEDFIENIVLR